MDYQATKSDYATAAPLTEPETPRAFNEMADAAKQMSVASSMFIDARRNLQAAKARYAQVLDMIAKSTEVENI